MITRREVARIFPITRSPNTYGDSESTIGQEYMSSFAEVSNAPDEIKVFEKYRDYSYLLYLTFSKTPKTYYIANTKNNWSIYFRGSYLLIADIVELSDNMRIRFLCYLSVPNTNL